MNAGWLSVGSLPPIDYDYLASSLTDQLIAAWPNLSQIVEHRLCKRDAAMASEYEPDMIRRMNSTLI